MTKQNISELQAIRKNYKPPLPTILKNGPASVKIKLGAPTESSSDKEVLKKIFANTYGMPIAKLVKGQNKEITKKSIKVGVVFSGGPAPGGHNVIAGLFDALKKANPKNKLIGFLNGPSGILENNFIEINSSLVDNYRNTGGFDMIGTGRTKIETQEQFEQTKKTLTENGINALVIIGGDDSNTNAGLLAEYFKKENLDICVVGVPKTIDGDLKNNHIETSFGFDTATKLYAELVGNIAKDACSSRKYWHFIRLMGRSASHIALEVALKTHPNIVLIGEEVLLEKKTLAQIVEEIVDVIVKRAEQKKNFGIVLIPEGLIEFIPEIKELISKLNDVLAENEKQLNEISSIEEKKNFIYTKLPENLVALMKSLPENISSQLLLDRDPHGNVQVSLIETEKLLIDMVKKRLSELKKEGKFTGKFSALAHFFGYEGRCLDPSNFDANYAYALGYNAAVLVLNKLSGYMSVVKKLTKKPAEWECAGIPLTMMMNIERRKGKEKPVIKKALVDLNGAPFKFLKENREKWALTEDYLFPGPIQYFGPSSICDMSTITLKLENKK
ncbi:MAG: diphosphate--fructose-6-phosphate 1-phosphotransferase [Candidatus Anstonellales archaeon]